MKRLSLEFILAEVVGKYARIAATAALLFFSQQAFSQKLLVPMDKTQSDHLKAYGVAYWSLERGLTVEWLLNYRGLVSARCVADS
jgi:hypothetical protein